MSKHKYKTLSKRARSLLKRSEGYRLEFKETLQAMEPEDMVAFANSPEGGVVLIGVREAQAEDGHQCGKIVGCPVGDPEKLSILNRAESCVPPIAVEVIVENADRKPFFRVEIPSGSNKPYCTAAGTFKIRGNGRTLPLLPSRLLSMFMASENQEFVERFKAATKALEREVADTKARLMEETERLLSSFALLDEKLEAFVALNGLGERGGSDQEIDLPTIARKVDALLRAFKVEDPCAGHQASDG
jgi:predicted HTH transcriptional regulator